MNYNQIAGKLKVDFKNKKARNILKIILAFVIYQIIR